MIVVIVADQYGVDRWKGFETDPRRPSTARADPRERAASIRPDGIRENVLSFHLNQDCRVIDERHAKLPRAHADGWGRARRRVRPFPPRPGTRRPLPSQEIEKPAQG